MEPKFDSIEAIEKAYAKRIKDAEDDDEKRNLALEQREVTADWREANAARRELEAHRTSVLATAALPAGFDEFVTGSTPEEIDASVAKVKERVATLQTAAPVDPAAAAREAYGRPGSGSGGAPPPTREDPTAEQLHDYENRFNTSTRGSAVRTTPAGNESPATITVREGEQYMSRLLASHAIDHLAKHSKNPMMREAASRIDPMTLREKGT